MTNSQPISTTTRGRPKDPNKEDEQKQKLMAAAQMLMREKSYRSITIREVGAAAGVNSAMVNYYFGGKEALFIAAVNDMAASNLEQVQQLASLDKPIRPFIEFMVGTLNSDTGLARFIHDEVLNESSPLREGFINGLPRHIATLLPQLVERELHALGISANLNTKYAAFSLVSMIIAPYLGTPIRLAAWKISDQELADPAWVEHLYQLFLGGIKRGQ